MAGERKSSTPNETRKRLSSEVRKVDQFKKSKPVNKRIYEDGCFRPSTSKRSSSRRSSERGNELSKSGAVYKHGVRISADRNFSNGHRKSPIFEEKLPAAYRLHSSHPKAHYNNRHNGTAPFFHASFPSSPSTYNSRGMVRGRGLIRRGSRGASRRGSSYLHPQSIHSLYRSRRDDVHVHRRLSRAPIMAGHYGKPALHKPPYEVSPDRNQRPDSPIQLDHKELMAKMRESKDADNLDEYHRYRDMLNDLESESKKQSLKHPKRSTDRSSNMEELELEEVDCIDATEDKDEHQHSSQSLKPKELHSKENKQHRKNQSSSNYHRSNHSSTAINSKQATELVQTTPCNHSSPENKHMENDSQLAESSHANDYHKTPIQSEHQEEWSGDEDEEDAADFFQFADDVDLDLMVKAADRKLEDNFQADSSNCTEQDLDLKEIERGDEDQEVCVSVNETSEVCDGNSVKKQTIIVVKTEQTKAVTPVEHAPKPPKIPQSQACSVPIPPVLEILSEKKLVNTSSKSPIRVAKNESTPAMVKGGIIRLLKAPIIIPNTQVNLSNPQKCALTRQIISLGPSTSSNLVNDPLKRLNNFKKKEEKAKPKARVLSKQIHLHQTKKPHYIIKKQKHKFRK